VDVGFVTLEKDSVGVTGAGVGKLATEETGMAEVAIVVGATVASLTLTSTKLPPEAAVVVAAGCSGVSGTTEVEEVDGIATTALETTAGVVEVGLAVVLEEETTAATVDATVADEPKLLDAVVEAPLLIPTLFTITISPSVLVIFTSTVVVPNPLEFSKKL